MRSHFTVLLLALLCAPPAWAQDPIAPLDFPAFTAGRVPDWSGFYAGGALGLGTSQANYNYSSVLSGELNNHTRIGRINGAAPGFFGGYNQQFGSIVLGLEGDVTFSDGQFNLVGPNFDALQYSNAVYTGSGRLGVLATPSTMVYGRLGYSRIDLAGFQNFGEPFHKTISGTQYAVGVENLIDDHVSLRVEAAYTSANQDLVLNQGFDHYRPSFLWLTAGLAFKIDPLSQYRSRVTTPSLVAAAPNWTGVHAGGQAGVASTQVTRYDSFDGGATKSLIGPYNDIRFTGGFNAGADLQLGTFLVVGAEFSELYLHSTFDDDVGQGLTPPFVHRFAVVDRIGAVTGRAGVLVTPATLIYARAGMARMNFIPQAKYFQAVNPTVTVQASELPAQQAGFGTETMITNHIAIRVEGLYTRADRAVIINGVQPAQFTLQPSAFTATTGLVVKY